MAKIGTTAFIGSSGKTYKFEVFEPETFFNEVGAVYVFGQLGPKTIKDRNLVEGLFIGETSTLGTHISAHDKWSEAAKKGSDCICVMGVIDLDERREHIAKDLIQGLKPMCNNC